MPTLHIVHGSTTYNAATRKSNRQFGWNTQTDENHPDLITPSLLQGCKAFHMLFHVQNIDHRTLIKFCWGSGCPMAVRWYAWGAPSIMVCRGQYRVKDTCSRIPSAAVLSLWASPTTCIFIRCSLLLENCFLHFCESLAACMNRLLQQPFCFLT